MRKTKFAGALLKRLVTFLLECTKWTIIPQLWFKDENHQRSRVDRDDPVVEVRKAALVLRDEL